MATFTEFCADVRDYLNRSDITDATITTAAKNLIRELESNYDFSYMRAVDPAFTFSSGQASKPNRLKTILALAYVTEFGKHLLRPLDFGDLMTLETSVTYPLYYCLVNDTIYVRPVPDDTTEFTLEYTQFSDLSAATTHWLLDNAWNVVLYGVLFDLLGYLKDEKRAEYYLARYNKALEALISGEIKTIYGDGPFVIRPKMPVI